MTSSDFDSFVDNNGFLSWYFKLYDFAIFSKTILSPFIIISSNTFESFADSIPQDNIGLFCIRARFLCQIFVNQFLQDHTNNFLFHIFRYY